MKSDLSSTPLLQEDGAALVCGGVLCGWDSTIWRSHLDAPGAVLGRALPAVDGGCAGRGASQRRPSGRCAELARPPGRGQPLKAEVLRPARMPHMRHPKCGCPARPTPARPPTHPAVVHHTDAPRPGPAPGGHRAGGIFLPDPPGGEGANGQPGQQAAAALGLSDGGAAAQEGERGGGGSSRERSRRLSRGVTSGGSRKLSGGRDRGRVSRGGARARPLEPGATALCQAPDKAVEQVWCGHGYRRRPAPC